MNTIAGALAAAGAAVVLQGAALPYGMAGAHAAAVPGPRPSAGPSAQPGSGDDAADDSGKGSDRDRGGRRAEAASAQKAVPKTMTIQVANDRTSLTVGDIVTYRITVHAIGSTPHEKAVVTQLLPQNLKYKSGTGNPTVSLSQVVWTVAVEPGKDATVEMTAEVLKSGAARPKLSTTACVAADSRSRLMACNTDFDTLVQRPVAPPATRSPVPWRLVSAVGGGIVLAGGGMLLIRRRRRAASEQ